MLKQHTQKTDVAKSIKSETEPGVLLFGKMMQDVANTEINSESGPNPVDLDTRKHSIVKMSVLITWHKII